MPAASRDDARPILTGVLLTATADGCASSPPTRTGWRCATSQGVSMLAEGQKVLVGGEGPGRGAAAALGDGEIEVVLGEREVVFRVAATEVTTRLIEGEFPNYQQLIPSGYPNRLTVVARRARGGGRPRADRRPEPRHRADPARDERRRPGALGDARRTSARRTRRSRRSSRAPTSPSRSTRSSCSTASRRSGPTRSCIESIDPLKPAVLRGHRHRRLPVPADAGAHRPDRPHGPRRRPGRLWLDRLPLLRGGGPGVRRGVTVITGANGQGKTSLLEAVGWVATRAVVPWRARRRARARRRRRRRSCAPRSSTATAATQLLEAEMRAVGPQPGAASNQQPLTRDPRPARARCGSRCSRPTTSQLVKGGPGGRRDVPRRPARRGRAALRRRPARDYERVLRQRNALLRGGVRDDDGAHDARGVRRPARRGRRRARARPAAARRAARAGRGRRLRRRSPATRRGRRAQLRGRVGARARRADRTRRRRSCARRSRARRRPELDRGVTLVGPHRDEWRLVLDGLDARTPRVAGGAARRWRSRSGSPATASSPAIIGDEPVLLLDDVFSELDPSAPRALVAHLAGRPDAGDHRGRRPGRRRRRARACGSTQGRVGAGTSPLPGRSGEERCRPRPGRRTSRSRELGLGARARRDRAALAEVIGISGSPPAHVARRARRPLARGGRRRRRGRIGVALDARRRARGRGRRRVRGRPSCGTSTAELRDARCEALVGPGAVREIRAVVASPVRDRPGVW